MITVSYKDFISNSGNIQLDKIEDKLRNLFLVDSKIKLKEVDKIYTIDNINDFIRDISLFLKDEQKCSEENNQDIKQSLQVEQSIAVEQEDDSEYNVYRTWWGKTFAIFVVVWLISMFTSHDWGTKDFSKKYSLRYSVSIPGYAKAWISVSNRVLYSDEIYYLDFIEDNLGLELHNITTLDLCLDLSCDVARMIRRLIRNKNVTTFLNTKEVKNRNEDRPEITYITSGNMNKDKYLTVSIKQKKAIKDKGKGTTLTAYNKKAEIANSSGKKYIEEFYNNPGKLHRLEVHLNNDEVKEYLNRTKQELSFYSLIDNRFLYDLFDQTLNSLIRFEYKGIKLDWDDLLLGVITTTPEEDSVLKLTSSKRTKKVA